MRRSFRLAVCALIALLVAVGLDVRRGAAQTISPSPFQIEFDNSGKIVNNGCIWTYVAGTTTPATTWSDAALSVPNLDPIRSNSAGRFTAFLSAGSAYKFVYESSCSPPSHGTVYVTADNITAVPGSGSNVTTLGLAGTTLTAGACTYLSDGSGGKTAGQWFACDSTNTYSSTTPTIGLAVGAIASGTAGSIQLAGQATGLSALVVGSSYFVSTSGTYTAAAPGNRRYLGQADSTTSLILSANPAPVNQTVVTSTATGAQNNFDPGIAGDTIIRWNGASSAAITGFSQGYDGQRLTIVNVTASQIFTVADSSSSSTAGKRCLNRVASAPTPIALKGSMTYVYDGTSAAWRLVQHDQGGWIAAPFVAGDYTASTGNWTVISGNVTTARYRLNGTDLEFDLLVTGTTVTATPATLRRLLFGFTSAATRQLSSGALAIDNGGTEVVAQTDIQSGETFLRVAATAAGGSWSASTTNTSVIVTGRIEVQ